VPFGEYAATLRAIMLGNVIDAAMGGSKKAANNATRIGRMLLGLVSKRRRRQRGGLVKGLIRKHGRKG